MAFLRPTASQLIERIQSDIESRITGADAKLRRTVEGVAAIVLGGASHGLHGHIQHAARQIIPSTDNDEEAAERWGSFWLGDGARIPAALAIGTTLAVGTPTTPIPTDTLWTRADGVRYLTDAPGFTIDGGGTVSVSITAETAAAAGNAVTGTILNLVQPIPGVNSASTVEAPGLTNGADQEAVSALITRVEARVQTPSKGGAAGDYTEEMLKTAGVTRAFEFPLQDGPGTVVLYFVRDADSPITPTGPQVTAMQTVIDAFRPVTAIATVAAPTAIDLDASIQIAPFPSAAVEIAIDAQLTDYLQRRGGVKSTLLISEINEAISIATGETDHILISPVANKVHTAGQIPVLGTTVFAAIP